MYAEHMFQLNTTVCMFLLIVAKKKQQKKYSNLDFQGQYFKEELDFINMKTWLYQEMME